MDQCISDGDSMSEKKKVLAFDFGASSGRAMMGIYDGNTIELSEVHRFSNDPVIMNGTMYWDVLRLLYEIKQGLLKAKHMSDFDSIGIDTWGVDFGLIDKAGYLLDNPVHYRDKRTEGMLKKSFELIAKEDFYQITGNQFMEINTAFQLLSLASNRPEFLEKADKLLFMPDLFNFMLTGVKSTEYSIASTSQLMDAMEGTWSNKVLHSLGLPTKLFTNIVPSGTKIGELTNEICEELGLKKAAVIAVASHDTQSALVAIPTKETDFVFLSCGTWSLLGTELPTPLINEKSIACNITNEGGYGRKASFLKNIIGLWLIQESCRQWKREGKEYTFTDLEIAAEHATPFKCFIDPDAPEFIPSGNIPQRIREFCSRTNQQIPTSEAEIVRCINESLALKYRYALDQIKSCTEKEYSTIYMVGGGTQSKLLCQMTANACHCKVTAGPIEATILGNVALQLISSGAIGNLEKAREIIGRSSDITHYQAIDENAWDNAFERFKKLLI